MDIVQFDLHYKNTYELGIILYNFQMRKWKLTEIKQW